jgi:hypothetical protein
MQTHQFHLILGTSEEATLQRQYFPTADGARLELWVDGLGTVYELSLSRILTATEPPPDPLRALQPDLAFSELLRMPRLHDPAESARVIVEWRGHLLATPLELVTLAPAREVAVVER